MLIIYFLYSIAGFSALLIVKPIELSGILGLKISFIIIIIIIVIIVECCSYTCIALASTLSLFLENGPYKAKQGWGKGELITITDEDRTFIHDKDRIEKNVCWVFTKNSLTKKSFS